MSTDDQRRKTRERVRRHRQRHKARLALANEMRPSASDDKPGRRPTWTVYEIVDSDGLPRLVGLAKATDSPPWKALFASDSAATGCATYWPLA
jgi:hypothetical protein